MTTAPEQACNYAVIRFLPDTVTAEFINVGLVVHCPGSGLFDYRLAEANLPRLAAFFPNVDLAAYGAISAAMMVELDRVRHFIGSFPGQLGLSIFLELVRIRESVLRFGEIGTILTRAPETVADELFQRHVHRHAARQPEPQVA